MNQFWFRGCESGCVMMTWYAGLIHYGHRCGCHKQVQSEETRAALLLTVFIQIQGKVFPTIFSLEATPSLYANFSLRYGFTAARTSPYTVPLRQRAPWYREATPSGEIRTAVKPHLRVKFTYKERGDFKAKNSGGKKNLTYIQINMVIICLWAVIKAIL